MHRLYFSDEEHVKDAIDVIVKCLESVKYDSTKFCVSFNGGKDCTALLHLVYLVLKEKRGFQNGSPELMTLLILMPDSFPELQDFIRESVERYNLDLVTVNGPNFKEALKRFKMETSVEYIFMGTRETDPAKPVSYFEPTDPGWPSFTRVNPLLYWSYHQIWNFLLDFQVPYCSLYDKGYTSLGSTRNTSTNAKLKDPNGNGYLPAYMLDDSNDERQGRC